MSTIPLRIGILLGSSRIRPNNPGVASWVNAHLTKLLSTHPLGFTQPKMLNLLTPPLPLGPVIDDYLPQALVGVPNPNGDGTLIYPYASEKDREWSHIVQQLDAIIVVTPQYNWGYPGELKNALDHLFNEFVGMPFMVVTYGGRGGGKAAAGMSDVLHGLRAIDVSSGKVTVPLPKSGISGDVRFNGTEDFFKEHDPVLNEELAKMIVAAETRRTEVDKVRAEREAKTA